MRNSSNTADDLGHFCPLASYPVTRLCPKTCLDELLKRANFGHSKLLFYFVKVYCLHIQESDPIARFCLETKARTTAF
ncbi:hypothetical protein [Pseudoalteromonas sp. OANN1]|uniref:hypothetical protein n=1 Tax=Pseudoalteromonas sp. OANN1 TaxID=2954497 RepID=UPI00209791D2|nr:hypothetical protein [Pseudoalteromonas sp. OANN1]MCO7199436.1 hypothetical protein [Pseudoalteromonas sp. OANN1]